MGVKKVLRNKQDLNTTKKQETNATEIKYFLRTPELVICEF